jgi:hypothetical protein
MKIHGVNYVKIGLKSVLLFLSEKTSVDDTITGVVLKKYPKFNFISNNFPFVGLGYNDNHHILYQFKMNHLETKVHSSNLF